MTHEVPDVGAEETRLLLEVMKIYMAGNPP